MAKLERIWAINMEHGVMQIGLDWDNDVHHGVVFMESRDRDSNGVIRELENLVYLLKEDQAKGEI